NGRVLTIKPLLEIENQRRSIRSDSEPCFHLLRKVDNCMQCPGSRVIFIGKNVVCRIINDSECLIRIGAVLLFDLDSLFPVTRLVLTIPVLFAKTMAVVL